MLLSADGWVAVLTGIGVVVTLASGFTIWMKRIDRALMKAAELPDMLTALEKRLSKAIEDVRDDHSRITDAICRRQDEFAATVGKHGERLATLEARGRRTP
ncbi:MAG TPA: hypothetical protein VMR25_14430 [Planctomycetaceae bacterium]|jgi:DNA-binding FadR family transcriptional regulator|nr:hypothetical protein [Planctomycetaceae bacterium]